MNPRHTKLACENLLDLSCRETFDPKLVSRKLQNSKRLLDEKSFVGEEIPYGRRIDRAPHERIGRIVLRNTLVPCSRWLPSFYGEGRLRVSNQFLQDHLVCDALQGIFDPFNFLRCLSCQFPIFDAGHLSLA